MEKKEMLKEKQGNRKVEEECNMEGGVQREWGGRTMREEGE